MVRKYCQISCVWWFKSFTHTQRPIVDILCSGPAINTHSKKWNITILNPMAHLDDDALDQQYFFTLPSSLDPNDVVQLIQPDTISYDLADLEEEDFAEWRWMKEEELRARRMRKSRCVKAVEKGVTASSQIESNREWFPWHMLVAFEVLGWRVEG